MLFPFDRKITCRRCLGSSQRMISPSSWRQHPTKFLLAEVGSIQEMRGLVLINIGKCIGIFFIISRWWWQLAIWSMWKEGILLLISGGHDKLQRCNVMKLTSRKTNIPIDILQLLETCIRYWRNIQLHAFPVWRREVNYWTTRNEIHQSKYLGFNKIVM